VLNVGLVFLRAPGDEAIRSSDPARRRRCGPRPHEARTLPRRTDAVRHCGDRQTQLHGGGRLIVTCTATTASHATDSSRDPQSLAAQNIPFRRDPAGQPGHGSAVHNGGSRVTAVISDRDTALQMLESTSDLIESVCARTDLIAWDIASRRLGSVYGRLATAARGACGAHRSRCCRAGLASAALTGPGRGLACLPGGTGTGRCPLAGAGMRTWQDGITGSLLRGSA
jgi:hypothetical protein